MQSGATGQNLIAHLDYSALHPSYTGELDMSPLFLKLGANQTVNNTTMTNHSGCTMTGTPKTRPAGTPARQTDLGRSSLTARC